MSLHVSSSLLAGLSGHSYLLTLPLPCVAQLGQHPLGMPGALLRHEAAGRRRRRLGVCVGSFAVLTWLLSIRSGVGLTFGLISGFVILHSARSRATPLDAEQFAAVGLRPGLARPACAYLLWRPSCSHRHGKGPVVAIYALFDANTTRYGDLLIPADKRESLLAGSWGVRLLTLFVSTPYLLIALMPLWAVGTLAYWTFRLWRKVNIAREPNIMFWCRRRGGLLLSLLATRRPDVTHLMYLGPLFFLPWHGLLTEGIFILIC